VTRGKYAQRSALRNEDASVQAELGSLRSQVERLTVANQKLRTLLQENQESKAQEIRSLRDLLAKDT